MKWKFDRIFSSILGKGYCHWSETHGTGDDSRTEHYYGREKIFEYKCVIYGQSGGGSRVVLPAGQTSYQFAFTVPNNIPSSFEGRIGHIRYEMKGLKSNSFPVWFLELKLINLVLEQVPA